MPWLSRMARTGSCQSREPRTQSEFPTWAAGTQLLDPHGYLPWCALAGDWNQAEPGLNCRSSHAGCGHPECCLNYCAKQVHPPQKLFLGVGVQFHYLNKEIILSLYVLNLYTFSDIIPKDIKQNLTKVEIQANIQSRRHIF